MKIEKPLLQDRLGLPGRLILDHSGWVGPLDDVQMCPWSVCCYSSCRRCACGEDFALFYRADVLVIAFHMPLSQLKSCCTKQVVIILML